MYRREAGPDRLAVEFTGGLAVVDEVCRDVSAYFAGLGAGRAAFEAGLLLREALSNAIIHGHGNDPDKPVRIELRLEGGDLILEVRDLGQGFDWRQASFEPPEPSAECGRGLFLMRRYADEVRFNEQGTAVIMRKRLAAEDKDMSGNVEDQGRVVLEVGEAVSTSQVGELRETFKAAVNGGARELVLDCSRLAVLDSLGIGLLVATHNSLARAGGRLVLIHVRPDILELLKTMRLDRHFTVSSGGLEG